MHRSAAFIRATLGFALILGACSPEKLGQHPTLSTGTGGTTGRPSGTGDGGMATSGHGGASSGSVGDGGSSGRDIGGSGDSGGSGTVAEGDPCMADGDCAGMQHFCMRSACDTTAGICTD